MPSSVPTLNPGTRCRPDRRAVLIVTMAIIVWILLGAPGGPSSTLVAKARATIGVSVLAGAITGIVETLLMYPVECIKTQQQLSGGSFVDVARRTFTVYGCLGLYRGMTPVLIGAVPTQAIRWMMFEMFCSAADCSLVWNVFLSGMFSGVFVAIITGVPIESFKTHMIHTLFPTPFSTPIVQPLQVVPSTRLATTPPPVASPLLSPTFGTPFSPSTYGPHHGGIFAVKLKGWMPTIVKKIMNQSIRFPMHMVYLRLLCTAFAVTVAGTSGGIVGNSRDCAAADFPLVSFLAGMAAGLTSILISQPVDVVKSRMQGIAGERYGNMLQCFRTLAREEGLMVFTQGIGARSLRVSLGAGITFTMFPMLKAYLKTTGS